MVDPFTTGPTPPFQLRRRGVVLRPDPAQPWEQGGVLNPAAVSRAGVTYIFYRAVALTPANYSRILIATCELTAEGRIVTERLGRVALEPAAFYEVWADGQGGGVEDPRITPLEGRYIMAYTAYGTVDGVTMPRIALAASSDLFHWERLGLAHFSPLTLDVGGQPTTWDMQTVPNKDAILFPERIGGRYALLHRPMFPAATGVPQSIWLSWSTDLLNWTDHRLVLPPTLPWESLKVGGGTPPLRTPAGLGHVLSRRRGAGRRRPRPPLSCRGAGARPRRPGAGALPVAAARPLARRPGREGRRRLERRLPHRRRRAPRRATRCLLRHGRPGHRPRPRRGLRTEVRGTRDEGRGTLSHASRFTHHVSRFTPPVSPPASPVAPGSAPCRRLRRRGAAARRGRGARTV